MVKDVRGCSARGARHIRGFNPHIYGLCQRSVGIVTD